MTDETETPMQIADFERQWSEYTLTLEDLLADHDLDSDVCGEILNVVAKHRSALDEIHNVLYNHHMHLCRMYAGRNEITAAIDKSRIKQQ